MDEEVRLVEGLGNEVFLVLLTVLILLTPICYLCWTQRVGVTIDSSQLPLVVAVRRRIWGDDGTTERDENGLPHNYQLRPTTIYGSSDDPVCPICLTSIRLAVTTSCGHIFCGPCLTTYWTIGESNWSGSPISCPVCRAQVTLILISFREANQLDSQRDSVIDLVRQYNRRFSGAPRPLLEYLRDVPVLLPHLVRRLFSFDGMMVMFRLRVAVCLVAALLYLFSPLDIIPESIFGLFGLLDDIFVLLMIAVYTTVAYRRALGG